MVRVRFVVLVGCVGALVALAACVPPDPGPSTTTSSTTTTVAPGPEKVTGVTSFELFGYRNCLILDGNRPAACAGRTDTSSVVGAPVSLTGTDGATDTASGWQSDCVVAAGRVMCRGDNQFGQLGTAVPIGGFSDHPVEIPGISAAVEVVAGFATYCARLASGSVVCWGDNQNGLIGDGTTTASATPVEVVGVGDAVALSADYGGICALRSDGQVSCWGRSGRGDGNSAGLSPLTPTTVEGISTAVEVVRPRWNSGSVCAVLADGTVRCWGSNTSGQVGDGTTTDRVTPVTPTGLGQVRDLALTSIGGCAIRTDGTVACWGHNIIGRIGDGEPTNRLVPTTVIGLPGPAERVATSGGHSCATLASGELWCWGDNTYGQLGDGTTTGSLVPVRATGLVAADEVQVTDLFSCAVDTTDNLWCWGVRRQGSLGIAGSGDEDITVPTRVDAPVGPPGS